jgi:hypothetical protein
VSSAPATSDRVDRLRWIGIIGIAVIAIARTVIFFAAQLAFDVDPAFDPMPLGGLGPAGSLTLDVALILVSAAALAGETLSGRGLDRRLLVAALLPVPIVLWHGLGDAGDRWLGMTWVAAMIAGVATAHLARDRVLRGVLVIALVAGLGPLLVRGAANVTYEYDENIALFEANRASIFAEKGWEEGSPYALIFERRVRHRQPQAWFITTNILAALLAFGVVTGTGLAVAATRGRLAGGWAGAAAIVGAAAAVGVWMSGSKGAVAITAGGLALLLVALAPRAAEPLRRWGPAVAVGCVVAALLGVAVRGAILPESFAGDRSLLFRWHYAVSSMSIIGDAPFTGVGPDGYQAEYIRHRVARNPEEVASAHSMFWDWLATLGVAGGAWIALVLMLVARAGRRLTTEDDEPVVVPWRDALGVVGAVVVLGLLPALVVELHTLHARGIVVRLLGVAAFGALAWVTRTVLAGGAARVWTAALAAAAIALVVHGQIEMTFTQPGAVVWLMVVLGTAGGAVAPARPGRGRGGGAIVAALLVALAGWTLVTGVLPAVRQEGRVLDAARVLWPLADAPPTVADELDRRSRAAGLLVKAHDLDPTNLRPRVDAADQLERAARRLDGADAVPLLEAALAETRFCLDRGETGRALVVAVFTHARLAQITGDPVHMEAAIALQRDAVAADPNGLLAHQRLADLLWEAGRRDEARAAYERTLEIDRAFELDPLKQLPAGHRAEIERRLGATDD